jgi:hypothetical protein
MSEVEEPGRARGIPPQNGTIQLAITKSEMTVNQLRFYIAMPEERGTSSGRRQLSHVQTW